MKKTTCRPACFACLPACLPAGFLQPELELSAPASPSHFPLPRLLHACHDPNAAAAAGAASLLPFPMGLWMDGREGGRCMAGRENVATLVREGGGREDGMGAKA